MKRKQKKAIKQTFILFVTLCSIFVLISMALQTKDNQHHDPDFQMDRSLVTDDVIGYEDLVEEYAEKYNVADYKDVLLAMMMQESGGHGDDPMQASENYCGEIGCIEDPEVSIKQGVHYFANVMDEADGDLQLAIQSYNFGRGFIDYVQDRSASYTQKAAIDFSKKMYKDASDKSNYTCLRKEAEQYDACYGDIYYVRDVMEYKDDIEKS